VLINQFTKVALLFYCSGKERRKSFAKHSIVSFSLTKTSIKRQEVQQPFDPVIDVIKQRNFRHC
jgi:hypothetical protein